MLNYFTYDYGHPIINTMKVINIIGLLLITFFVFMSIRKKDNVLYVLKDGRWTYICLIIVLFIAAVIRIYRLDTIPVDLAPDEASVYYDALCLANYGTNRLGEVNSVYFNTWEFAGQSPAMATLASVFIKLFGNSLFVFRLSQAIPAFITIILVFLIGKKLFDPIIGLICSIIMAISPWHIMMSRWVLDCNLSSFAITAAICALVYSFNDGKMNKLFYLFCILTGLSLYTYAPTDIMMFIFVVAVYLVLLLKKKIDYKIFIPANILLFIIALPMIYFLGVNILGLQAFENDILTIPYMEYFRSGDVSGNMFFNFLETISYLYTTDQRIVYYPQFSIMFIFSIPVLLYGIYIAVRNFNKSYILLLALIACVIQIGMINNSGNWVIVNLASLLPYFIALGIIDIIRKVKSSKYVISGFYIIGFLMFLFSYFAVLPESTGVKIGAGQKDAIEYAQQLDVDKIYFTEYNGTNDAFIYCALTNQHSPQEYTEKTIVNPKIEKWKYLKQYDNIVFFEDLYNHISEERVAFVLYNYIDNITLFQDNGYEVKTFRNFSVAFK